MTSDTANIHSETLRIHANQCDFQQALKPAAFFQHFTEAAGVHAQKLGVGFEAMAAQNLFWVLSRMKIKFWGFPHAGDTVILRTWPKKVERRMVYIRDYEMLDAAGRRLAGATSSYLVINAATRRMAPPKSVSFDLPADTSLSGLDESLERIDPGGGGEERLRVQAGYSAVDILGHVNNGRYADWICDAFPLEMYRAHELDWLQINFEHEIMPGEEVAILASRDAQDGRVWALEGHNQSSGQQAFEALVRWKG